jgi:hypothetical protein
VGICPFQIAIYASRAYGACLTEPPPALLHRVSQIEGGQYEHEWRAALSSDRKMLNDG